MKGKSSFCGVELDTSNLPVASTHVSLVLPPLLHSLCHSVRAMADEQLAIALKIHPAKEQLFVINCRLTKYTNINISLPMGGQHVQNS